MAFLRYSGMILRGTGSLFSANSSAIRTLSDEYILVIADALKFSRELIWGRSCVRAKKKPAKIPQIMPAIAISKMKIFFFFDEIFNHGNSIFGNLQTLN